MARKKSEDLAKTRQVILEAGLNLFQEKGFHGTGIQEIASIAAVPKGSFYNYFASKDDFGVAVIRFYTETSLERWKNRLEEAERAGAFSSLVSVFLEITESYECMAPKHGCLLGNLAAEISEASEACRKELENSVSLFKDVLAKKLRKGQEVGQIRTDFSADILAGLVWNCWQGSLLQMKIEASVDPVKNNLSVLFSGLLCPMK